MHDIFSLRHHVEYEVQVILKSLLGLATLGILCAQAAQAEKPGDLVARIQRAKTESTLDAGVKPWHMKLAVQLFDAKGTLQDQGLIEEWWNSPTQDRRDYKTKAYAATEIRLGDKLYRTKGAGTPPYDLQLLHEQAVDPLLRDNTTPKTKPELRKTSFGKVTLDCIMMSQPLNQVGEIPLGLFPTYCFDAGQDVLRATFDFGNEVVVRNSIANFQGKFVARHVDVMSHGTKAAASDVLLLETEDAPSSSFQPSGDLEEQHTQVANVAPAVVAGMVLSKVDPVYPNEAKHKGIDGRVLLHAVIGANGHIHSLEVISSPDPSLAMAAIAAVRQWVYRPYMLLGVPTEVDTTITVTYTMTRN